MFQTLPIKQNSWGQSQTCVPTDNFKHNFYKVKKQQDNQNKQNSYEQTPFKIKVINFFGLKNILIQKLIFARRNSTYKYINNGKQCYFQFQQGKIPQVAGYQLSHYLIDGPTYCIPIIHFKKVVQLKFQEQFDLPQECSSKLTIIYSHGNASDLQDSFKFVSGLLNKYQYDFIIYDYTGYGNSHHQTNHFKTDSHKISDQSIADDLKEVVSWSKIPTNKIALWGFSLGCHPTISVATKHKFNSIVLLSPFASIYNLLSDNKSAKTTFKQDFFDNLSLIDKVKCNILLMHSSEDQIIPIDHAYMLMKKFDSGNHSNQMKFYEVKKLKHNQMHPYFTIDKANRLQVELKNFLFNCQQILTSKTYVRSSRHTRNYSELVQSNYLGVNLRTGTNNSEIRLLKKKIEVVSNKKKSGATTDRNHNMHSRCQSTVQCLSSSIIS